MKDGKMTVINRLPTEEYLYSVLGKEMSPSWPIEALKAQAICARTYAVRNWNKFSSYGFNLCTTTVSQVYGGIATESERTIDAVNQTSGQLFEIQRSGCRGAFLRVGRRIYRRRKNTFGAEVCRISPRKRTLMRSIQPRLTERGR
ncbi:MAG: SpoIID/LytB domain-containing protein [Clostridiales bacterium]|nr:MAG: SpoIID/LytB domain-containing protein [Clostridiales bacterium]